MKKPQLRLVEWLGILGAFLIALVGAYAMSNLLERIRDPWLAVGGTLIIVLSGVLLGGVTLYFAFRKREAGFKLPER